ncbi:MAG: hypothetical protein KJO40_16795, partial [Deltaproteobacteria bacterium]|nr:hypothetical protein [Deltaproteobacteria bacterium]
MPGSHLVRCIILLCGALAAFGCANTDTSQGSTGSLSLDLLLAGDIQIDVVTWEITGNGMEMSGSIDVAAPGSTASVEVYGLPVGEEPYSVELTAVSVDQEVTCGGSAEFDVEVGVSTPVMVVLNCKLPQQLGGVRVNGKFNICTELTKAVVSPLQTSVGNQISLSAQAFDEEGDAIQYIWTGTGGSIADPSAASTTYTCQDVGEHTVMIMVTDNDVYCRMATWTVPVTCVEGDGGDLCEDVMCEDDGNECTETACNPANGACETSNVADGTECDGGAGTCSGGQCVEVDLCEGVDCDDNNECTADACDPADGSCSGSNVDDGTPCNNDEGVCSNGSCVDVNLCEGVVCDDTGNECTVAMCNNSTGQCDTMNVADGTECNGGSGACSAGECVDNNLCDGVDCTSSNECVQDGTCDPADGQCIAGANEPTDTACSDGGTVCDGAGACVECNIDGQCPEDGNECTVAVCDDSDGCLQNNVMDGLDCDFGGSAGVCESGTCVAAPECAIDADCDDGNPCSVGACPDGMCVFTEASDGTACDVSAGVPGTCAAGDCVGLCDGVDCTSGSQCVMDGACDDQTGSCVVGGNEPAGTDCAEDGGNFCDGAGNCVECNGDGQCASDEACVDNVCETVVEVLYTQDFEALDPTGPAALADDGWLYFGNVYTSTGGFKFGFGPFVAPTVSGQISGIATGEGGPDQGAQQLVVFSNYDCCQPGEGHFGTDLVETIVFQEIKPIPGSFIGQTLTFTFDAKRGNIEGGTTAQAFIR